MRSSIDRSSAAVLGAYISAKPSPLSSTTAVLLLALAVIGSCLFGWRSLSEAPRGAAGTGWDAARGMASLRALIPDERPHPVGSIENARVRDRIVAALREAGYAPEVRATFRCEDSGRCGSIENIVAVRGGGASGRALLVTAHYDSVEAGPGASDDMAGVAILLELARSLPHAPLRNDVVFLFSDGEEAGLHGANAFAETAPEMHRIGAVVNVEARGVSGASLMFETGPGNARLIEMYAREIARPVSNSLIYEIYKSMPNDTDFSVYRKRGIGGFNFAFVGGGALYHSARDLPANLDRDTFQHHGDHVFAMAKALASADLDALRSTQDVSYFDLFSRHLFVWPSAWDPALALAALTLIVLLAGLDRRRLRGKLWAALALLATPLLLYGLGWLIAHPLGIWTGAQNIDHPAPWPARIALASAAILTPLILMVALRGRVDWRTSLWCVWFTVSVLATVAALTAPGAAYAFTWPSLAFALLALGLRRYSWGLAFAAIIGFILATLLWTAHFLILEAMLGLAMSAQRLVVLTVFAWALLPLFIASDLLHRRSAPALLASIALTSAMSVIGGWMPAYTPERPRGVNITYYDDGHSRPFWGIESEGPDDEAYLRKAGMSRTAKPYRALGVFDERTRLKPAARLSLPSPSFARRSERFGRDGVRVVAGDIRGTRDGRVLWLAVPETSSVVWLRVQGYEVWRATKATNGLPRSVRIAGMRDRPLPVEVAITGGMKADLILSERSPLPDTPEARALIAARPRDAAPVHAGDAAMISVHLRM
jgi:hypothetical protein